MNLLSKKDLRFLENLRKLLEFGASYFENRQLIIDNNSYKQNFLLLTYGVIHNYSESIYVLCKDARPHSSNALLRSIFEAHLNVQYLLNTNSDRRLALYAVEDIKERNKAVNSLIDFIDRYPHWENKYGVTTRSVLEGMKQDNKKYEKIIRRANNITKDEKLPGLIGRAKEYDKKISSMTKKGEIELNYNLIYRQLSPYTHLNPTGVQSFLKDTSNHSREFAMGQSEGIEPVITTTFNLYLSLLIYMKKWKIISKNSKFIEFNEMLKEMAVSLQNMEV